MPPPDGDAAGAALGARGVACFLLFLPASLLFVFRFLPMSTRALQRAQQQEQECTSPKGWRHAGVAAMSRVVTLLLSHFVRTCGALNLCLCG